MSEPSRRKFGKRLILLALLCLAGGIYLDWRQVEPLAQNALATIRPKQQDANKVSKEAPAVPVGASDVKTGDFPVVLTGLGTVQPYNTVLIRSRVDGQVMKIAFEEGQIVHQGDLLVEIDPRPYQAALDQAKAKKEQDAANLENTKRDLARSQSLVQNNYVTRQTLDTQASTVAQLTAQLAADDAATETASVQLGYATIRAPITGRVGFRLVDQGNIVNAASETGIVSIAQIEPIAVVFTEPEKSLGQITDGLKTGALDIQALTSDGTKVLALGKLETLNNEIDTSTGTIRLKAAFANTDHHLWPGLSVSTALTVATLHDVVMVPATAVQHGPSGLYAFVIGQDGKVDAQPLKVSLSDDKTAVVTDGIKAGDKVVTSGQYRLQPHTLVKIVPDDGAKTAQRDS